MPSIKRFVQNLFRNLSEVVRLDDKEKFRESFLKLHNRDRAKRLFSYDEKTRKQYYTYLSARELARILESIRTKDRLPYLLEMSSGLVADILAEMYTDNAVDTLNALPAAQLTKYMGLLKPTTAHKIGALLHYGDDTAGSIMTSEFIAVKEKTTAGEALEILKKEAGKAATVSYIYITNGKGMLTSVVSLKHIILADKNTPMGELGTDNVLSIQAVAEKIDAARMLRDYNFVALPIVDFENHLVGVITVDDIVDLIDQAAAEHYSHLAAIGNVELTDGPFVSAMKRLPWLVLLLFLGMLTATLIGQFEGTLARIAILGAFIPVVAGTTGNSGTQSLAIMVRGIATGKMKRLSLKKYFVKEATTAFVTSVICGIVLVGIILVWKQELFIGLVAGGALAASIFLGTLTGTFVPLVVSKFGADPAVASGPLITTICDVLSMGIYFGLATMLIDMLL